MNTIAHRAQEGQNAGHLFALRVRHSLLLLCTAAVLSGCASLQTDSDSGVEAELFYSYAHQGDGIYILNMRKPEEGEPHMIIDNLTDTLTLDVKFGNGNKDEILLQDQTPYNFGIQKVDGFNADGNLTFSSSRTEGKAALCDGRKYRSMQRATISEETGRIDFIGCAKSTFSRTYTVATADAPEATEDEGSSTLTLTKDIHRADITLALDLKYLVAGKKQWHHKTATFLVRVYRPEAINRVQIFLYKPLNEDQSGIVAEGEKVTLDGLAALLKERKKWEKPLQVLIKKTATAPDTIAEEVNALCEELKLTGVKTEQL